MLCHNIFNLAMHEEIWASGLLRVCIGVLYSGTVPNKTNKGGDNIDPLFCYAMNFSSL